MNDQLHAPTALPQGKEAPGTNWTGGWVRRSGNCGVDKNLLPLLGIEHGASSP
jgi:hypothetical protein